MGDLAKRVALKVLVYTRGPSGTLICCGAFEDHAAAEECARCMSTGNVVAAVVSRGEINATYVDGELALNEHGIIAQLEALLVKVGLRLVEVA